MISVKISQIDWQKSLFQSTDKFKVVIETSKKQFYKLILIWLNLHKKMTHSVLRMRLAKSDLGIRV